MKAARPDFEYRKLATMLGFLARDMRARKHARVHVPIARRDAELGLRGGFDRFSVEDVEAAQLEAERLARLAEVG